MEVAGGIARKASAAVLIAALALIAGAALVRTPRALTDLDHKARDARAVSPALRPYASARETDIDLRYILAAKAYIPSRARYFIDQGAGVVSGNPVSASSVKPVTQFLLYPRRPVLDASGAAWLICYGCDANRWRARFIEVWQLGPLILERRR